MIRCAAPKKRKTMKKKTNAKTNPAPTKPAIAALLKALPKAQKSSSVVDAARNRMDPSDVVIDNFSLPEKSTAWKIARMLHIAGANGLKSKQIMDELSIVSDAFEGAIKKLETMDLVSVDRTVYRRIYRATEYSEKVLKTLKLFDSSQMINNAIEQMPAFQAAWIEEPHRSRLLGEK